MSKSIQQNPQKETKKHQRKIRAKNKRHPIAIFLSGVGTAISLCAAIYSFWPHVGIEMNGTFDPLKKSYFATAVITNNGIIPLKNVTIGMRFGPFNYIPTTKSFEEAETVLGPDKLDTKPLNQPGFGEANWKTDQLVMDQKFSVRLENPIEVKSFLVYPKSTIEVKPGFVKLFRIHMGVVVSYNLWIFPIRLEREQMFRTEPSKDYPDRLDWLYE